VAKEHTNRATGIINLARNIGGSAGIAMVTSMLARRPQFHQNVLVTQSTAADGRYCRLLENPTHMLIGRSSDPIHLKQAQGLIYRRKG
jgi:MFS transporter, DHA2 family, multidrug resistance protein